MKPEEILREDKRIISVEEISVPEDFTDKVFLHQITYRSGGCEVTGLYAYPLDWDEHQYPVVIFNRGGNRDFGPLQPRVICAYAAGGYHAFGSQYRGGPGSTGTDEYGGADVADVIKLIDISASMPFVARGGIYMAGHSRGGMMTYLCCTQDDRIVAAAIGAGLADCVDMYYRREQAIKDVFMELVGGAPEELPEEYRRRSAVCWAGEINVPLLIGHGTNDWRVDTSQSRRMAEELTKYGKEHRLMIYEGADHSLRGTSFVDDVFAWFRAHPLGGK